MMKEQFEKTDIEIMQLLEELKVKRQLRYDLFAKLYNQAVIRITNAVILYGKKVTEEYVININKGRFIDTLDSTIVCTVLGPEITIREVLLWPNDRIIIVNGS